MTSTDTCVDLNALLASATWTTGAQVAPTCAPLSNAPLSNDESNEEHEAE